MPGKVWLAAKVNIFKYWLRMLVSPCTYHEGNMCHIILKNDSEFADTIQIFINMFCKGLSTGQHIASGSWPCLLCLSYTIWPIHCSPIWWMTTTFTFLTWSPSSQPKLLIWPSQEAPNLNLWLKTGSCSKCLF